MPCDTIQLAKVKFSLQTDYALLRKAMLVLGFSAGEVSSTGILTFHRGRERAMFKDGEVKLRYDEALRANETTLMNAIKRAYSTEVVKQTAANFNWKLKYKSANTFDVERGY